MISIIDFLHNVIGITSSSYDFLFYILAGAFVLLAVDGILSFIFGSISGFTMRK